MWIVNKYGWIGNGNIDQCICINIREGGNASNPNPIYPINYNWVDNLECNSIDIWNLGCTQGYLILTNRFISVAIGLTSATNTKPSPTGINSNIKEQLQMAPPN